MSQISKTIPQNEISTNMTKLIKELGLNRVYNILTDSSINLGLSEIDPKHFDVLNIQRGLHEIRSYIEDCDRSVLLEDQQRALHTMIEEMTAATIHSILTEAMIALAVGEVPQELVNKKQSIRNLCQIRSYFKLPFSL